MKLRSKVSPIDKHLRKVNNIMVGVYCLIQLLFVFCGIYVNADSREYDKHWVRKGVSGGFAVLGATLAILSIAWLTLGQQPSGFTPLTLGGLAATNAILGAIVWPAPIVNAWRRLHTKHSTRSRR